jgi:hypothetical protein
MMGMVPETLGQIGALAFDAVKDGPSWARRGDAKSVVLDGVKRQSKLATKV